MWFVTCSLLLAVMYVVCSWCLAPCCWWTFCFHSLRTAYLVSNGTAFLALLLHASMLLVLHQAGLSEARHYWELLVILTCGASSWQMGGWQRSLHVQLPTAVGTCLLVAAYSCRMLNVRMPIPVLRTRWVQQQARLWQANTW